MTERVNKQCPFCHQELDGGNPRSCENFYCSSGFTDWGGGSYYFIRLYENPEDQYSHTELVVESYPDDGLTFIRIRFQAQLLADVDRIYDPYNAEELNQLLKIVDRLHKNLSLR